MARRANEHGVDLADLPVTPADVARVQALVDEGKINDKLARQVFDGVLAGEGTPDEVVAAAVVNQGQRSQDLLGLDERMDGRGNPYFWIAFSRQPFTPGNGTDLWAVANRRIAVTPLRLDMTDEPTLTRFAQAFE